MIELKLRKYKMALLYSQTRELHHFYNSNKILPSARKYYLIEKDYLNNLKKQPDYDNASDYFRADKNIIDYNTFKSKLKEGSGININEFEEKHKFNESDYDKCIQKENLNKIISLIKLEFLEDYYNEINEENLFDIYLGNNLLIIKENNDLRLYVCEYIPDNENKERDFSVKIQYYLIFENESEMNSEINKIINENRVSNQNKIFVDNINKNVSYDNNNINININNKNNIVNNDNNQFKNQNNNIFYGVNNLNSNNNINGFNMNANSTNNNNIDINGMNINNNNIPSNMGNNFNNNIYGNNTNNNMNNSLQNINMMNNNPNNNMNNMSNNNNINMN